MFDKSIDTSFEITSCGVADIAKNGEIRLQDGPSQNAGRLHYFKNGKWGSVCDASFNIETGWPPVICQILGYDGCVKTVHAKDSPAGVARGHISLHNFGCGATSGICTKSEVKCTHKEDVYVECKGGYGYVRITSGVESRGFVITRFRMILGPISKSILPHRDGFNSGSNSNIYWY